MRHVFKFFDHLEDSIRISLSRYPIPYSFIGGVAIVLFWRGVWMIADSLWFMTGWVSLLISVVILLLTGLFVSFFIGDNIIITGIRKEKKLIDQTENEISTEADIVKKLEERIRRIEHMVKDIEKIEKKDRIIF